MYRKETPYGYFIEKYTGGPVANQDKRSAVSPKRMVRAAVKIQSWARVMLARRRVAEKRVEKERQEFIRQAEIKREKERIYKMQ